MSSKDLYLRSLSDKGDSPENLRLRSVADKEGAPPSYPYHRRTLKGTGPYSGRRGFDETTGHRRGFWP